MANIFLDSTKGSLQRSLLDNHMTNRDESFITVDKGMEIASTRSDYAYYGTTALVGAIKEFECKVSIEVQYAVSVLLKYPITFPDFKCEQEAKSDSNKLICYL